MSVQNYEATEDPDIVITSKGISFKSYKDLKSGEQWTILGQCNCCGECEVGSTNPNIKWIGKVGEPNAEYDITFSNRKDIPVRPEIKEKYANCQLWGFYF